MAVGALVALGAVAGGRSVSAAKIAFDTIKTLVGNYVSSTATEQHHGRGPERGDLGGGGSALAHGDEVAHIIAELRTFTKTTDDWNDMNHGLRRLCEEDG